jgi:hypothetical protein
MRLAARLGETMTDISKLFDETTNTYELAIFWNPAAGNPQRIHVLTVNDVVVAIEQLVASSPARFHVPSPTDGKFTVKWAITPEIQARNMSMGIKNDRNGNKVKVDEKVDVLNRGDVWTNEVSVDAP